MKATTIMIGFLAWIIVFVNLVKTDAQTVPIRDATLSDSRARPPSFTPYDPSKFIDSISRMPAEQLVLPCIPNETLNLALQQLQKELDTVREELKALSFTNAFTQGENSALHQLLTEQVRGQL